MKILAKVPLNPYSGYGQDGIGIIRALMRAGLDVYVDPSFVSPPLPPDVAQLLTRRLEAPFDLLLHHVDPAQLELSPEARRAATTAVAWTMWEYSTVDNLKGRTTLRRRLRDYDLVLGYDGVTAGALQPHLGRAVGGVLQGGFWPEDWEPVRRDWNSTRWGFCMVGQLHQRKDPFVAIQAFKELKDEYPDEFEPAELHLKTNTPGLHMAMEQWVPKLRVHYATWPVEVLRDFYAAQHVLLAPSRGEGKNMPALEFMATGGTVIATNWGGHTQWLSSAYAYPLDYELLPESPSTPHCMSARASKDHLKALMLHTLRNRDEVARKAAHAADVIPLLCHWDAVVDRLFIKLGELVPRHGHQLLHSYRRAREEAAGKVALDV
jgi:glycosyltransferase involved in cell wall biosynthesis